VSITDSPGRNAYPIANFAWLLVPGRLTDPEKRRALTAFIKWAITDGQTCVEPAGFAKLPPAVVTRVNKSLTQLE
jgi:phosphate transport system substrate-binding protein